MAAFRLHDRFIFPDLNEVRSGPNVIHVEPKAMSLLVLLAQRPFELVRRDEILTSVWAGVFVGDAVLTNAVSIIRRALGDSVANPRFVQTVPKRGYRLITPVLAVDGPLDQSALSISSLLARVRCFRQEETVASVLQARRYAEEIARMEPGCGAAYGEIALADLLLEKLGRRPRSELRPAVEASVDKALTKAGRHAVSYVAAAKSAYIYRWDWPAAERMFNKAITVDPSDADVRTELAIMLMNQRRFREAGIHLKAAYRLDPLSPVVTAQMGHLRFYQGDMPSAIRHYETLLRLSPAHLFGRWCMAAAFEHAGQPGRAKSTIHEGLHLLGLSGAPLLVTLCRVHLLDGKRDSADCVLEELKQRTDDPLLLSHVMARCGERQKTLALLEQGAAHRHYRISDINALPSFRRLRDDRDFHLLMRGVGLPT